MCDMPYMAFFNLAETNRLSFGAEALEWDCRISSKINQEKGVYAVTLTVAADAPGKIRPFKMTIDRRSIVWTEALADWRNSLSYNKGRYPEAAWKPVYCTWYAVHAALSQDWVERTCGIDVPARANGGDGGYVGRENTTCCLERKIDWPS
jgi:hypothetical protein